MKTVILTKAMSLAADGKTVKDYKSGDPVTVPDILAAEMIKSEQATENVVKPTPRKKPGPKSGAKKKKNATKKN